jgi:hypothetical protein
MPFRQNTVGPDSELSPKGGLLRLVGRSRLTYNRTASQLTHSIATMSMMPIQDSQESVDALPKSNDMELAHRIPLPASTSTFFLSSDTPSHLDSTDNPVSSSNSRNILRNMNESALPPVDKGLRAWSFVRLRRFLENNLTLDGAGCCVHD